MSTKGNRPVPWSPDDIAKLNSMTDDGIGRDEIAAELGRTKAAIDAKLSLLHRDSTGSAPRRRQQRRNNGAQFFLS